MLTLHRPGGGGGGGGGNVERNGGIQADIERVGFSDSAAGKQELIVIYIFLFWNFLSLFLCIFIHESS